MKHVDSGPRSLRFSGGGLWILLAIFAVGCGDKAMPSQPPIPASRPTPSPAQFAVTVTLSRRDPAPGYKHAAHADFVVTETGGRPLSLTGVQATGYYVDPINVSGFVPLLLEAGQTRSFGVDLNSQEDIPCQEGIIFTILSSDEYPGSTGLGCEVTNWPF